MIKNKTILITGGAGFIGVNLLRQLVYNNKIIIMDNFNDFYDGKKRRLLNIVKTYELQTKVRTVSLDICKYKNFDFIKEPIDIIIHLAAYANVRYSAEHPWDTMRNNYYGTLNVLKYAAEKNVDKLIFTSSSAVYGNSDKIPISEDCRLKPISPYGICKCLEEGLLQKLHNKMFTNHITILRFSTVYGTYGRNDMVINKFLSKVLINKGINVYGDGSQVRDYVYIDDVISAIVETIDNPKSNGQIINIGSGRGTQIKELLLYISEISNKTPIVGYLAKNKVDVLDTTFNIKKAKEILNYEPKINLLLGLKKTQDWIKKNSNKYYGRIKPV